MQIVFNFTVFLTHHTHIHEWNKGRTNVVHNNWMMKLKNAGEKFTRSRDQPTPFSLSNADDLNTYYVVYIGRRFYHVTWITSTIPGLPSLPELQFPRWVTLDCNLSTYRTFLANMWREWVMCGCACHKLWATDHLPSIHASSRPHRGQVWWEWD